MSQCNCDSKRDLRITGEYLDYSGEARLRCNQCGGKVGYIPVDTLCDVADEPEQGETLTIDIIAGDNPFQWMDK